MAKLTKKWIEVPGALKGHGKKQIWGVPWLFSAASASKADVLHHLN
jgi:hypothetical protein